MIPKNYLIFMDSMINLNDNKKIDIEKVNQKFNNLEKDASKNKNDIGFAKYSRNNTGEAFQFILECSHIYMINHKLNKLFKNIKNKTLERKLPFKTTFLDAEITFGNINVFGILLLQMSDSIAAYFIFDVPSTHQKSPSVYMMDIFNFRKTESTTVLVGKICGCSECKQFRKKYDIIIQKELTPFLGNYIYNFLDFLNNPDVEIVSIERTKEQNEKRIKKGKSPIPLVNNVRVTGKLKIYLDNLDSHSGTKYSHMFDVRSHWRTLRSEKWKNKMGTRIWIPNYLKGEGIYIKKEYNVKK